MLVFFAIALMLLGGELARQFILMHFINVIFILILARFFLSHTLRRQLNTVGGQLTPRWHANTVWAR